MTNHVLANSERATVQKCHKLSKALVDIGLRPTVPDGGNFMLVDMSLNVDKLDLTLGTGDTTD